MAVRFLTNRTDPVFGFHSQGASHMTVADFAAANSSQVVAVAETTETSLSAALDLNAKSIRIIPKFESGSVRCDIEVYSVIDSEDVLVYTFRGVTSVSQLAMFVGNRERVDLNGLPVKIKVVDPMGGWVSVNVIPN